MGRRDCCLPIVSAVLTQWMLHLWSQLPNATLIEIILTTETKKYRNDTTWQGKPPPSKQTEEQIREKAVLAEIRREHNKVEHSRD